MSWSQEKQGSPAPKSSPLPQNQTTRKIVVAAASKIFQNSLIWPKKNIPALNPRFQVNPASTPKGIPPTISSPQSCTSCILHTGLISINCCFTPCPKSPPTASRLILCHKTLLPFVSFFQHFFAIVLPWVIFVNISVQFFYIFVHLPFSRMSFCDRRRVKEFTLILINRLQFHITSQSLFFPPDNGANFASPSNIRKTKNL